MNCSKCEQKKQQEKPKTVIQKDGTIIINGKEYVKR